ncbi:hypothetical protein ACFOEE_08850 [Pseudoalteromonas fenneropenaei]|uniref:Lipoprotein n=1 Tax=Pseudoalteromonas fenneropenaei TaxID=1737459 RepID=A0ABV7CJ97_9GAMM
MKTLILAFCSLSLLAGCQLTRVEGEVSDVKVKVATDDNNKSENSDGKFCPPGQAKKGKC